MPARRALAVQAGPERVLQWVLLAAQPVHRGEPEWALAALRALPDVLLGRQAGRQLEPERPSALEQPPQPSRAPIAFGANSRSVATPPFSDSDLWRAADAQEARRAETAAAW